MPSGDAAAGGERREAREARGMGKEARTHLSRFKREGTQEPR